MHCLSATWHAAENYPLYSTSWLKTSITSYSNHFLTVEFNLETLVSLYFDYFVEVSQAQKPGFITLIADTYTARAVRR